MRLWHISLLPKLPWPQLIGQHREVCALRGNSWGKKHSTVDYVFKHNPIKLFYYHLGVMGQILVRKPDTNLDIMWYSSVYRGKNCKPWDFDELDFGEDGRYPEHNEEYYQECIENLRMKGVEVTE